MSVFEAQEAMRLVSYSQDQPGQIALETIIYKHS